MNRIIMEVIALTLEDLKIAQDNGTDRIELACGLAEGALTPSYGFMEQARRIAKIPIFSMIRPRHGDFNYSQMELEAMIRDIKVAEETGMDGIIFGVLNEQTHININAMNELLDSANRLNVTFHRAFDSTFFPEEILQYLLTKKKVQRLLTSGQAANAISGAPLIRELQSKAGEKLIIVPGVGITPENAAEVTTLTRTSEIHLGIGLRHPENPLGILDGKKVKAARIALDNMKNITY